jgi:hypothetical protein
MKSEKAKGTRLIRETPNRGFGVGTAIKLLVIRKCRKKAIKEWSDNF